MASKDATQAFDDEPGPTERRPSFTPLSPSWPPPEPQPPPPPAYTPKPAAESISEPLSPPAATDVRSGAESNTSQVRSGAGEPPETLFCRSALCAVSLSRAPCWSQLTMNFPNMSTGRDPAWLASIRRFISSHV